MKISELIKELQNKLLEHGDLRVTSHEILGIGVVDFRGIKVQNIRAKKPRESKTYYGDDNDISIEKVLHI